MNRSNLGNVVTNGMQVISVAGYKAGVDAAISKRNAKANAQNALNNLSDEERSTYTQMQTDRLRQEMIDYQTGAKSPTQHMSNEEQVRFQKATAQKRNEFADLTLDGEKDEPSIDEIMRGKEIKVDSPQGEEIKIKAKRDTDWLTSFYKELADMNRITEEEWKKGISNLGKRKKDGD